MEGSIPKYVLISPASAVYAHLKLFSICSITVLPRSSPSICNPPGLPQACPHDAMHLPSIMHYDKGFPDD